MEDAVIMGYHARSGSVANALQELVRLDGIE